MRTLTPGHFAADDCNARVNAASTSAGLSSGMMRRSSRNTTRSGTTLVLMPPSISPTTSVGEVMPAVRERIAV